MKISIIIAAYNVENYIEKCIESVLNQTYKNIEIIIVNDGSSDQTRELIKKYSDLYNNIIVINKENGGLSSARNCGLDIASGDYVGFIDGDDYIKEDMYETLIGLIKKYNCEIAICGIIRKYATREKFSNTEKIIVMDKKDALKNLIESKFIHDYAVDKLYSRELFNDIKYPIGKTFEDVFTTYKIFDKCKRVVFFDVPKYYYVQRQGSILRTRFSPRQFDHLEAIREIKEYVQIKGYKDLIYTIEKRYTSIECRLIYDMLKNSVYELDLSYDHYISNLMKKIKYKKTNYLIKSDFYIINKIIILMSILGLNTSKKILKFYIVEKLIKKRDILL